MVPGALAAEEAERGRLISPAASGDSGRVGVGAEDCERAARVCRAGDDPGDWRSRAVAGLWRAPAASAAPLLLLPTSVKSLRLPELRPGWPAAGASEPQAGRVCKLGLAEPAAGSAGLDMGRRALPGDGVAALPLAMAVLMACAMGMAPCLRVTRMWQVAERVGVLRSTWMQAKMLSFLPRVAMKEMLMGGESSSMVPSATSLTEMRWGEMDICAYAGIMEGKVENKGEKKNGNLYWYRKSEKARGNRW